MAGDVHGRGHAWQGGVHGGGMHGRGGHAWQGGMYGRRACMAGKMAIAVGSMHPTGMDSCLALCQW